MKLLQSLQMLRGAGRDTGSKEGHGQLPSCCQQQWESSLPSSELAVNIPHAPTSKRDSLGYSHPKIHPATPAQLGTSTPRVPAGSVVPLLSTPKAPHRWLGFPRASVGPWRDQLTF